MRDQLQTRLGDLKREYETGQTRLQELERQRLYLQETLLRISGAIQVLEELLSGTETRKTVVTVGENQSIEQHL